VQVDIEVHYAAAAEVDSTVVQAYTALDMVVDTVVRAYTAVDMSVDMVVQHMVFQWGILLGKGLVQRA